MQKDNPANPLGIWCCGPIAVMLRAWSIPSLILRRSILSKQNKEVPRFSLRQTFASLLIFFIFSLYVWLVQIHYEQATAGYEKALYFSLGVFGAGFSYDCAKKIFFLLPSQFKQFWGHFCSLGIDLFAVTGFTILSGVAFQFLPVLWVGQLLYLVALGWVWFLINSATAALEVAAG